MRFLTTLLVLLAFAFPAAVDTAEAQNKRRGKAASGQKKGAKDKGAKDKGAKGKKQKEQRITLTSFDLQGQMRTPQLLYFLERAGEELKRAALERRSFIPDMVRSIDEEEM